MVLLKALVFTLVTFLLVSCQRDTDEGRPYEFGFTIDGEQHRHEKKDVKGIIQGEFGFITADGIYHVTVYATDENGNFKILSRRNVRISAPLDGSPLPPGQVISGNQPTKSIPTNQNQQLQPPKIPLQKQPLQPQSHLTEVTTTTLRPRTTYAFTTQPTIKPACAGCGYITTIKPKPGQPFPFQNPAFQKPILPINSPQPVRTNNLNNVNNQIILTNTKYPNNNQINTIPTNYPNTENNYNKNVKYPNVPEIVNYLNAPEKIVSPVAVENVINRQKPEVTNGYQNLNAINLEKTATLKPQPFFASNGDRNHRNNVNHDNRNNFNANKDNFDSKLVDNNNLGRPDPGTKPSLPVEYPNIKQTYPTTVLNIRPNKNTPLLQQQNNSLSQVSIDNDVIHVPGNPDIQIKDKYPGMVDGLPNGIEEKDITNLLYKFNYTIGFHGHYEKGLKDGTKIGGYFVNGRDGVSQVVTYIADENGFRPKVKFIRLDLNSDDVPKEATEKTFGLKNFEFIWYPVS